MTFAEWARRQLTNIHAVVTVGLIREEMNKPSPDLSKVREDLEALEFELRLASDGDDEDVTSYVEEVHDEPWQTWEVPD